MQKYDIFWNKQTLRPFFFEKNALFHYFCNEKAEFMEKRARGIVLHVTKYNDEAVIADVLTEEGRVAFLVRQTNARRAAVKRLLFQPLALLEIEWSASERTKLAKPKAARCYQPYASIPYEPLKSSVALFLCEFLRGALRGDADSRELFEYISSAISYFDLCKEGFANFHLVFLLRLTRLLGFAPNLEEAGDDAYFDLQGSCFTKTPPTHIYYMYPEEARHLPTLLRMRFETMHLFRFSRAQRSRLLHVINDYYRLHLPGFPELKSLEVLESVFTS